MPKYVFTQTDDSISPYKWYKNIAVDIYSIEEATKIYREFLDRNNLSDCSTESFVVDEQVDYKEYKNKDKEEFDIDSEVYDIFEE